VWTGGGGLSRPGALQQYRLFGLLGLDFWGRGALLERRRDLRL